MRSAGRSSQPQRRGRQPLPGQAEALLLAGGQGAQGGVLEAGQADDGHRRLGGLVAPPAVQAAEVLEVAQRRQVGLEAGQVAEIGDVPGPRGGQGRRALDLHRACFRAQQPRQHAQQRGLAGAVAALHQQCLAGVHREVQRAEHGRVVAREREAARDSPRALRPISTLASTVFQGKIPKSWKTVAIGDGEVPSRCTSSRPRVGGVRPARTFTKVDFPQPEGPTRETNSPAVRETSTGPSACTSRRRPAP